MNKGDVERTDGAHTITRRSSFPLGRFGLGREVTRGPDRFHALAGLGMACDTPCRFLAQIRSAAALRQAVTPTIDHLHGLALPVSQEAYDAEVERGGASGSPLMPEDATAQAAWPSPAQCVEVAHSIGAVVGLAHPGAGGLFPVFDEESITETTAAGVDAIEAIHPAHTPQQRRYYERLASQPGLFVTGGSDYHGLPGDPSLGEPSVESLGTAPPGPVHLRELLTG